jgi:hypothetical protein
MTAKPRARAGQQPAAAPAPTGPLFINFALSEGRAPRRMEVRVPSPEQLAVWQSIGETFTRLGSEWSHQSAAVADLPADHPDAVAVRSKQNRQAIRGVGRSVKLIKSVLVNEIDHEWVDDMLLEGANLDEMLRIVSHAVDAIRESGGRSASGTTKAAPKAELTE